jgi:hypothetical protein
MSHTPTTKDAFLYAKLDLILKNQADILAAIQSLESRAPKKQTRTRSRRSDQLLDRLAMVRQSGATAIPKPWLAVMCGYSETSSTFKTRLATLYQSGEIIYPAPYMVAPAKGAELPPAADDLTRQYLASQIPATFEKEDALILTTLVTHGGRLTREELAKQISRSAESSTFRDRLAALRSRGFIGIDKGQTVYATLEWLPA